MRRLAKNWLDALDEARELPTESLPVPVQNDGPPPAHRWSERDPAAAERLARARAAVNEIAAEYNLPPENLITPDMVRRVAWEPPAEVSPATVAAALRGFGARQWQVGLVGGPIAEAMPAPALPPSGSLSGSEPSEEA